MSIETKAKTRRKRCSECGELKHDVLGRQRLCEDCEENKDYCQVCDEWLDRSWGDGCRHVQWSNEIGCCCGCGTTHIGMEAHKDSFITLLSKFAPLQTWDDSEPLLTAMLRQIEANNFWTRWFGPMIGGPPDLELRYEVRRSGQEPFAMDCRTISASEQEAWGEEAVEQMQLGMAWLTSLDDTTKEANRLTAYWIREYLERTT